MNIYFRFLVDFVPVGALYDLSDKNILSYSHSVNTLPLRTGTLLNSSFTNPGAIKYIMCYWGIVLCIFYL